MDLRWVSQLRLLARVTSLRFRLDPFSVILNVIRSHFSIQCAPFNTRIINRTSAIDILSCLPIVISYCRIAGSN